MLAFGMNSFQLYLLLGNECFLFHDPICLSIVRDTASDYDDDIAILDKFHLNTEIASRSCVRKWKE